MKYSLSVAIMFVLIISCNDSQKNEKKKTMEVQQFAQNFLDNYAKEYQRLLKIASEAEWRANTFIKEGDTLTDKAVEEANKRFASFTGSKENIETAKKYLEIKDSLSNLQVKQFENILYMAGANPAVAGDVVDKKIKADALQTKLLFGFDFRIDAKSVSTNEIDSILKESKNLKYRRKAWLSSKEVGKQLKEGLANLRDLRNKSVQALGYHDYFAYQVSDYGMVTEEMMDINKQMIRDVWPLYRELHTWARYKLAEKYHSDVPEMLPADWLPNRWGQDWTGLVENSGFNLDSALRNKGAEWILKQGEEFYKSLGFDQLPRSFWDNSSLYPLPNDAGYKKNNHASAWHMDNAYDVRSLMSVVPNTEWWGTVLHELGHIYYYMTYTNDNVPIILRGGANRGFHEAMGSLIGLASMQKSFLINRGLVPAKAKVDEMNAMLREALDYIVFMPFSAGVMTEFEHDLYVLNLPVDQFNKRWWELKYKYQGIVPPETRGEEYCDAASKTHINNDPAQYYDYAISNVLLFQFHDYIANKILHQDPHNTNYYGDKRVGKFLHDIMYPGATMNWRDNMQTNLGTGLSAKPMLDYFKPLVDYLKKQNEGRTYTLPETI